MTSLLAWLSFVSALAAVPPLPPLMIASAPACPDAPTLIAALNGLLPARHDSDGPDVLQLARRDDGLHVRLTDAAGLLIGEKSLPGMGTCEERAQTVAVMVAAWETHWRPDAPMALPRAPAGEKPVAPSPPRVPPSPAPDTTLARPPAPLEIETRAGLLVSIAGGSVAPAVTFDIGFGTPGSTFAVAVGALAVGGHDASVGPATVRWQRLGGTVDLRSRLPFQAFALELHAAAALTALSLSGQALPRTNSGTVFDPGALVGLRGRLPIARLMPWFEATAALWPAAHTAYVTGSDAQRDLPTFQLLLGAGLSFGAAPPARPARSDDE